MSLSIVRPGVYARFPEIRAGVSTREGGFSSGAYGLNMSFNVGDDPSLVRQNRALFLRHFDLREDQLAIPKQIHSDRIEFAERPGPYADCDALLTDRPGIALVVAVADCVPIFLYDPVRRACALVHAGWRGSSAGLTEKMVDRLRMDCGSQPEDLFAYVGHAAGVCCYEAGEEVAGLFADDVRQRRDGRWYLDLKSENRLELHRAGVRSDRIEVSSTCTICTPSLHSYRRDREGSGRMMAVVCLTS